MNKDVIYIEAEDDITDILSKVKNAKNKIVALVPPKKAGVLHSAVNFKLITKTATKAEKTVVLVSADESLKRLAATANIPVAKTLQSKPQLPHADDAVEFGDEVNDEVVEADDDKPKKIEVKKEGDEEEAADEEEQPKKKTAKKGDEVAAASVAKKGKKLAEPEELEDDVIKEEKPSPRKSGKKVPNFKKYQKFIIAGIIAAILIAGFLIWALAIAPAAKVSVWVTTYPSSLSEKVTFTDVEGNDDIDNGILYSESKTLTKTVKAEFEATGELDKGTKASGTITIVRPYGERITVNNKNFPIPKDSTFTIDGKKFIVAEGGSANVNDSQYGCVGSLMGSVCTINDKNGVSSGAIKVVAAEVGDSYNIGGKTSGITSSISIPANYKVTSSAMTGGTSKIVKIVSEKDVQTAEAGLDMSIDGEARDELIDEFGDEYILISSSFSSDNGKITTSPALNEEVGDGVTPQIVKEVKYTIYAVKREDVERFIKKIAEATITGDDTQMVHDTGIDKAFIDTFKDTGNGTHTGKIKTTFTTGPKITEQIVLEKVKGKRLGEVQPLIKSVKGVKKVEVKPSYFWVTTVPTDPNKITIELNSDQE